VIAERLHRQPSVPPVAVIGVGNILLSDEGIGVHVIRALTRRRLPRCIELVDGGTAGLALLEAMRHRRKVIIVDAVALKAPPGAVFRWYPVGRESGTNLFHSAHTEGIQELLYAGRALSDLPPIVCIGVVPRDAATPGIRLSRELRRRLPAIADTVVREALDRRL